MRRQTPVGRALKKLLRREPGLIGSTKTEGEENLIKELFCEFLYVN